MVAAGAEHKEYIHVLVADLGSTLHWEVAVSGAAKVTVGFEPIGPVPNASNSAATAHASSGADAAAAAVPAPCAMPASAPGCGWTGSATATGGWVAAAPQELAAHAGQCAVRAPGTLTVAVDNTSSYIFAKSAGLRVFFSSPDLDR